MEHIAPIMQRTLAQLYPGMVETATTETIAEQELNTLESDANEFDEDDDIDFCPECGGLTSHGVCENAVCKSRLI
jgi:hypothetical protein